jgi:hypothetical protein
MSQACRAHRDCRREYSPQSHFLLTIRITVPREPSRAGIDPLRKLIDREREGNVVDVKSAAH